MACGVLLLALLLSCRQVDESWQRVQQSGLLRVGLDPTFPPFEQADEANVWGLDVDLMRAVAADLGLEARFTYFGYDGLYDALATGQVDVLASALVVQPERSRDFATSRPYFDAGQVLVVPASGSAVHSQADLAGQTLAVELGAGGHVLATAWERQLPGLKLLPLPSVEQAVAAVAGGRAAAALVDSVGGRLALRDQPGLRWLAPPLDPEPYALVVRAGEDGLLVQLNGALERLEDAGTLKQIVDRWLGP